MKPQIHPLANLFPRLSEREFEALKEDIKKNGQQVPILLYQGKILDGEARSKACDDLGIEPITEEYKGDDPLGRLLSLNVRRRHLNESQRAMIAARLANMRQGERTDKPSANVQKVSQKEAAEMLHVSVRLVGYAKDVMEKAPERVKEIDEGLATISKTIREIEKKECGSKPKTDSATEKSPPQTSVARKVIAANNGSSSSEEKTDLPVDSDSEDSTTKADATQVDNTQPEDEIGVPEIIDRKKWSDLSTDSIRVSTLVAANKTLFEEMAERHKSKFFSEMMDMFRENGFTVESTSRDAPAE